MRWAVSFFWGFCYIVGLYGILLAMTLYFNNTSVLYLFMDATYSVLLFGLLGGIINISFMYSNLRRKIYKLKSPTRGGGMYSGLEYQAYPTMSSEEEGQISWTAN